MVDPVTPNKAFAQPTRNSDVGTWDVPVNGNMTILDNLLGGAQAVTLTNADVTLSQTQANHLTFNLTGTLILNVNLIFPAIGGFFFIKNNTTGSFTVTAKTSAGGSTGIIIPQGSLKLIYLDGTNANQPNGDVAINGVAGINRLLDFQTSLSDRWRLYANGTAESGSNAGSNLALDAIADDGSTIVANAFTISRATGVCNFSQSPQVGGAALLPTGSLLMWSTNTAPTGYLECSGAAVSRTTYANLFAIIGTVWGSGDGSTTFNLPNMQGYFPRGWSHGSSIDSGRAFASTQLDTVGPHTHGYLFTTGGISVNGVGGNSTGMNINTQTISTTNPNAGTGVSTENRPVNIAVMFIIKI